MKSEIIVFFGGLILPSHKSGQFFIHHLSLQCGFHTQHSCRKSIWLHFSSNGDATQIFWRCNVVQDKIYMIFCSKNKPKTKHLVFTWFINFQAVTQGITNCYWDPVITSMKQPLKFPFSVKNLQGWAAATIYRHCESLGGFQLRATKSLEWNFYKHSGSWDLLSWIAGLSHWWCFTKFCSEEFHFYVPCNFLYSLWCQSRAVVRYKALPCL
jgi:hypothetical protein